MMMPYIVRILIFFFTVQMTILPAKAQWENLSFSTFGSEQGLSQNTVQCILEDDIGFLWFGTRDGLNRYDGYKFLTYRKKEDPKKALLSSDIKAIAQDKDKLIWVAMGDGTDMNTINPITEEIGRADRFTDGSIPLSNIIHISTTRNGDLLFASRSSGLLRYRHLDKKIVRTSFTAPITFALQDKTDHIWLAGEDGHLYHVSENGRILSTYILPDLYNGSNSVFVTGILIDSHEDVWVGTYGSGLYKLDRDRQAFLRMKMKEEYDGPRYILTMESDIFGKLWIGTDGEGLLIFDAAKRTVHQYRGDQRDANGLSDNSITSIQKDRKGNMWIGTSKTGFSLVNIEQVNHLHYRNTSDRFSISNNVVNCIYEDREKKIWIGTDGGGVNIFDKSSGRFYNAGNTDYLRFLGKDAYVLSLAEDDAGNIWIGTWKDGLYMFNPKNKQSKHFHSKDLPHFKSNSVTSIVYMQGTVYFGTYGDGILYYEPTKDRWSTYDSHADDPVINSNHILSLYRTRDDRLLIGTEGGGLSVITTGAKSVQRYATNTPLEGDALTNNSIVSIQEDRNGQIWLGTPNGVNKMNLLNSSNKAFHALGYDVNSELVNSVLEDALGNIWVTTNRGLSRINPINNTIQNYTVSLGLQKSEFRKGKLLDQDGLLYFGSTDGLNIINPNQVNAQNYQPNLVLTGFLLNNKEVNIGQSATEPSLDRSITYSTGIRINYDYNVFNIEFTNLNFIDPEVKRYEYMIVGQNEEWQPLGSKNYLSFVRMPPGKYVLKLRATDNQGNWSPRITSLDIEIVPPFWATWWFRIIAFAVCTSLIILLFFLRTKRIRNKNKVLARKVVEKTSEISKRNEEILAKNEILNFKNLEIEKINRKITEQQSRILQQNQELEEVIDELKVSNAMKDKFFSILAHDLRNPITVISNISDFLREKIHTLATEEVELYLDDFKYSTNSINNLLINLLEWGKSKTDSLSFQPIPFNLYDLAQKVIYLFKVPIQEKKLDVQVLIEPQAMVTADYQMLYTILRNIIGNSIKFTHEHGHIQIMCQIRDTVIINIEDNGIGMTQKQVNDIFDQKVQHTEGTHGEKGTGLGFQICQEFIKAHDGHLHISSTPGIGTMFTISLPLYPQQSPITLPSDPEENIEAEQLQKYAGKTILVVDDNAEMRKVMQLQLGQIFHLEEAEDGKSALQKAQKIQPDLIITDLIMPEMDGFIFSKMIKSDITTSHIPILMLTGEQDDEHQIMSYKVGIDLFLKKPFNRKLLYAAIGKFLSEQEIRQHLLVNGDESTTEDIAAVDREFLDDIKAFVLQNITDYDLSYKSICQHFAISRSILYAKFKILTGQGVHDFIKNIRLEEAAKLLHEGRMNVSQVAYAVGFNSISYFSKSFTKKMGQSPKEFQKKS